MGKFMIILVRCRTILTSLSMVNVENRAHRVYSLVIEFSFCMIYDRLLYIYPIQHILHKSTISLAQIKPIRIHTCGISMFAFQLIVEIETSLVNVNERMNMFNVWMWMRRFYNANTLFDNGMKLPRFAYTLETTKISFFFQKPKPCVRKVPIKQKQNTNAHTWGDESNGNHNHTVKYNNSLAF